MRNETIFYRLVSFWLIAGLLGSGCTDVGDIPAGNYIFLTYTVSDKESLLVGDLRHIPAVICESRVFPYFKLDSVKKSLEIYNHTPFDIDGIQLLLWSVNNRFPGRSYCPSVNGLPVRNLPMTVDSSCVLEILSDGTTRLLAYGQEILLPPNQEYSLVTSPPRLVEGYYTIPPDTTQYPYLLQEEDIVIVRNYGWCPRNLISFRGL